MPGDADGRDATCRNGNGQKGCAGIGTFENGKQTGAQGWIGGRHNVFSIRARYGCTGGSAFDGCRSEKFGAVSNFQRCDKRAAFVTENDKRDLMRKSL